MLHEQQEVEERRVVVVRLQKAAIIAASFPRAAGSLLGESLQPAGKGEVVAFEQLPHELVLADEVAIERTFGDIDGLRDVLHGGFGHALLDEEGDGGPLDRSLVSENGASA